MSDAPAAADPLLADLLRAGAAVHARLERAVEPFGLSLAKMGALAALAAEDGPVPLGRMAARLACARSNVTQLVDRLQADGMVERVRDPDDRRGVRAVLTPAGRERWHAARQALDDAERELLSGLSPELREALRRSLAALCSAC